MPPYTTRTFPEVVVQLDATLASMISGRDDLRPDAGRQVVVALLDRHESG
jgi:hypothetical protein